MIRYGAHAFVWIGAWDVDAGNATIRAAAEAGLDFLEIPLLDPGSFDAASHVNVLRDVGLEATCSLVLPKHAHMPDRPHAAIGFLTSALEQCARIEARVLCGCIAYSLGTLKGRGPTPEEHQTVQDALGEVARRADALGITLALEACNRYETYLYNTLEDARRTVLAVGAPNLKLHADTYHMNIEETGFRTPILGTRDVLHYVHMSESHRGMVGTGTVDWEQVFQALKDANFNGYLALESFAAINPDIQAATCMWRAPKHSGAELAAGGVAYLRNLATRYDLH